MNRTRFTKLLSAIGLCTLLLLSGGKLQAQFTFNVTNLNDAGAGSLREALSFSNNTDTIRFSVTGTITLASELSCTKAISIIGPGSGLLTLSGGNTTRIMNINTVGALHIQGIRFSNANVDPSTGQTTGGGILAVADQLYLKDVVIANNAIGSSASNGLPNTKGGGAHITSQYLELDSVTVSGNTSSGRPSAWGGGLYIVSQQVQIINSTINGNTAASDVYVGGGSAYAGGAYINGDIINIENSDIYSNSAFAQSGWQTYDPAYTYGGGLYTENTSASTNTLTLTDVNLYSNYANSYGNYSYPYGGGWYGKNHNILIEDCSFYQNQISMYDWYDGSGYGYCNYFTTVASVQILNSIIRDHAANRLGYDHYVSYLGATGSVTIDNLKAYNNDINANYSEGIFFLNGSSGSINNSEFYNNSNYSASNLNTIVSNISGTLSVNKSSFYGNKRAFSLTSGNLNMVNSTMTTNTQDLYSTSGSSVATFTNCTMSGTITMPNMTFQNSILSAPTLTGTITSTGGNIINSPSYSANFTQGTDRNNVNPAFGTFDYHGGNTKLYAVQSFSQAINNGVANGQARDQRAFFRVGNVDIGSYEYNGLDPLSCMTTSTHTVSACGSYTWINGMTYTSNNNTATHTLTNASNCDSVVTLNLTINQPSTGTDIQTACGSYTWINGTTYTSSNNTATHTLTNAAGCDSVVTLNLTITQNSSSTDPHTACGSFTWINGTTYTSSNNTATHTLTNAAGCDSVVTLILTILPISSSTDVQTACGSFTWINGTTYTSSNNTATHTLTNTAGCDSVVTLNLTINNVDASVTNNSPSLVANASGATYQWLDCNNGMAPIAGQTGQSFTATANGNYAVQVTQNNCTDTSSCILVTNVGIGQGILSNIQVFPNPTTGMLSISHDLQDEAGFRITDLAGKVIVDGALSGSKTNLDISTLPAGIYVIEVRTDASSLFRSSIVKQ